jgi:hypothetical protein
MKKTLLFISTGFVGLTLLAALFGKITFEQFGYITPLVLSILYGIYQKVLNGEKDETVDVLRNMLSDAYNKFAEEESILESRIVQLRNENSKLSIELESYAMTSRNLRAGFDSEKQVIVDEKEGVIESNFEKPKRTRKSKK